jgi:Protein of unknown function (DUF2490)
MSKYFFISFVLTAAAAKAQRPSTGVWLTANVPVQLADKWQWHNDASYRTLGNSSAPLQYLYRTGIRYQFHSSLSAAAGVAFFFTRSSFEKTNSEMGKEFRTWQEAVHHTKLSPKLSWQNRLRTEQRFFASTQNKDTYTAHRFRFRSAVVYSLSNKWSLQFADEYMQQLAMGKLTFDQNRIMANCIYQFNKNTQLQAGYMWLLWPQSSSQHLFTMMFQKNISFNGAAN